MTNRELEILLSLRDEVTKKLKHIEKTTKTSTGKMGKDWIKMAAVIGAATIALRAVVRGIKDVTTAAMNQEDATNRLNNALKLQGEFTVDVAKRYDDFAKEMQRSTRFGNEAIQGLMQQLISVGSVAPEQMERATKAAVDFAAATGRDLKTAALTVGKAMTGFTGELSRYGIIIDKNIPATEKATAALEAMERQFGGFAQKDINSYSGELAQLSNKWGDLKEELGEFVLSAPLTQGALKALSVAVEYWTEKMTAANDALAESAEAGLLPSLNEQLKALDEQIIQLQNDMSKDIFSLYAKKDEAAMIVLLDKRKRAHLALLDQLAKAETDLGTITVKKTKETANTALEIEKEYTESVKKLWDENTKTHMEGLLALGSSTAGVMGELATMTGEMWLGQAEIIINTIVAVMQVIIAAVNSALGPLGWLKTALDVGTIIAASVNAYNQIDAQKEALTAMRTQGAQPVVNVPTLAEGGIVNRPTLAMIGEAGPEAVVPLGSGNRLGGVFIEVNIDNPQVRSLDDIYTLSEEVSEQIAKEIERV